MTNRTILLKGATLLDGTGSPPRIADLYIRGDRITFSLSPGDADLVLDLGGLCLAPGFIDVHGHSDFALLASPMSAEGKLLQGITTEIGGNCGLSGGPLVGPALAQREPDLAHYGIAQRWGSLGEFLDLLGATPMGINFATLVGQGNIRASVIGYEDRPPTEDEMAKMEQMLVESLSAGAIGLSTGLIYPPGSFTAQDEIARLCRAGSAWAGRAGRPFIYATHMRSEGDRLIEGIEEALSIGRASGSAVHISHLKTAGERNWHKAGRAIALMEAARQEGMSVTCDRYPYTASSTDLDAVLPSWAFEGGREAELARLRDPATVERLRAETRHGAGSWENVQIASVATGRNRWTEGMRLTDAARRAQMDPFDFLVRLLVEEELMAGAIFHSMSEENLERFLAIPYTMVGTDSTSRALGGSDKPHPRGFGSFPRFLGSYAPDLPLAISKITSLPARTFGLKNRGLVQEGFLADLTVFDPGSIEDTATYEEPYRAPKGIVHVFVGGGWAVKDSSLFEPGSGRILGGGG